MEERRSTKAAGGGVAVASTPAWPWRLPSRPPDQCAGVRFGQKNRTPSPGTPPQFERREPGRRLCPRGWRRVGCIRVGVVASSPWHAKPSGMPTVVGPPERGGLRGSGRQKPPESELAVAATQRAAEPMCAVMAGRVPPGPGTWAMWPYVLVAGRVSTKQNKTKQNKTKPTSKGGVPTSGMPGRLPKTYYS